MEIPQSYQGTENISIPKAGGRVRTLQIWSREQKNLHCVRHQRPGQWTGPAGSGQWFPWGALQTARLFSQRSNLLGVLPCLSSKFLSQFPRAKRQCHNPVIWQLEVSDRSRREELSNCQAPRCDLGSSALHCSCPQFLLRWKTQQSHREWAPGSRENHSLRAGCVSAHRQEKPLSPAILWQMAGQWCVGRRFWQAEL